jgi:hypothetical protein
MRTKTAIALTALGVGTAIRLVGSASGEPPTVAIATVRVNVTAEVDEFRYTFSVKNVGTEGISDIIIGARPDLVRGFLDEPPGVEAPEGWRDKLVPDKVSKPKGWQVWLACEDQFGVDPNTGREFSLPRDCLKVAETQSLSLLLYRRSAALENAPVSVVLGSGGIAQAQREKEQ